MLLNIMTHKETYELLNQAESCVEGECSLDEVGDLITLLRTQQRQLSARLDEVRDMVQVRRHTRW